MILYSRPEVPLVLAATIFLVLLYLIRRQAHNSISSVCRMIAKVLRMASHGLLSAERRLACRNREVLLAAAEEQSERDLRRQFAKIEVVLQRDLQGFPALHRKMADLVTKMDDDYISSTETPPLPSAWLAGIESFARPSKSDAEGLGLMADEIQSALASQQQMAVEEYRKVSSGRHDLLKEMVPSWRRLSRILEHIDKTMTGLQESAQAIEAKTAHYRHIRISPESVARQLSCSAMSRFAVSSLILSAAMAGVTANFILVAQALPGIAAVKGGYGGYDSGQVTATAIILGQFFMGLLVMETLGITRLFPVVSHWGERLRRRVFWLAFFLVLSLAGLESYLLFVQGSSVMDMESLRQNLNTAEASVQTSRSLTPVIGQAVLGFVLPLTLCFVAIPLASLMHSSRTVMGVAIQILLRVTGFLLRLAGNFCRGLGRLAIACYDLLIAPFLWVEKKIAGKGGEQAQVVP